MPFGCGPSPTTDSPNCHAPYYLLGPAPSPMPIQHRTLFQPSFLDHLRLHVCLLGLTLLVSLASCLFRYMTVAWVVAWKIVSIEACLYHCLASCILGLATARLSTYLSDWQPAGFTCAERGFLYTRAVLGTNWSDQGLGWNGFRMAGAGWVRSGHDTVRAGYRVSRVWAGHGMSAQRRHLSRGVRTWAGQGVPGLGLECACTEMDMGRSGFGLSSAWFVLS
jgi:hypothetical protein